MLPFRKVIGGDEDGADAETVEVALAQLAASSQCQNLKRSNARSRDFTV